ncbi:hypothetical protein ACIBKY_28310 [Nonomuraea sp. NPDC050394]|uniref:hypothetical protein n=1 Tax=Nonomuraea sp. NPDC050394 TaxID=3364363 RepID=UPI0037BD0C0A
MTRLAFGVVTHPGLLVRVLDPARPRQGAAVVVGPEGHDPAPALARLRRLVALGGEDAAGAGVDLGDGFRSARLAGAAGDRRDAVLAALRALGPERAHLLGERAGVLVALFGPAATKPVGAAAAAAVAEGRWDTLTLASAASDILGPEQLETLLGACSGPEGIAGRERASRLAVHLGQIFADVPRPRRTAPLLDLWERVAAHHAAGRRRAARLAVRGKVDREDELRELYRRGADELILRRLGMTVGRTPSLADAARWTPGPTDWAVMLQTAMEDAMAATVLLRTAVAVADLGTRAGLASMTAQLNAAAGTAKGSRRLSGQAGLPPRPGFYVRDLAGRPDRPDLAHQRLARARDYGVVVLDAAEDLLIDIPEHVHQDLLQWTGRGMSAWRAAVPLSRARSPRTWTQPVLCGGAEPLSTRSAREGGSEVVGDLLWLADLADALAAAHGHDAAEIAHGPIIPHIDWEPRPAEPAPLVPRVESVALALAGAARLVSLGGRVSRCRTWAELADGLLTGTAVAEALTGAFPLPEELARLDGARVPGTTVTVRWARDPRATAEWAAYMGNCIGGSYYIEEASAGRGVLAALIGGDGEITANLEIKPERYGWRVGEIRARFNADPEVELERRVRAWAGRLPVPSARPAERAPRPVKGPGRRPGRLFREAGEPLTALAERALADALPGLSALVKGCARSGDTEAGLVALRRTGRDEMARACGGALDTFGAAGLWALTGVRPMSTAIGGLEPALAARVAPLARDEPVPGSLRKLAGHEAIAQARTAELVAVRLRRALGELAGAGDAQLARAMARRPGTGVLCALTVAVTSWGPSDGLAAVARPAAVEIPGYPASSLADEDGPWHVARPGALELGADLDAFWDMIATHGLLAPAAWLGRGGWPVLWRRACDGESGRAAVWQHP